MDLFLDLLQWPAMAVTVVAVWLVGYQDSSERKHGFWTFLVSNLLWVIWGLHAQAYALVVLQCVLGVLNVRGILKNDRAEARPATGH